MKTLRTTRQATSMNGDDRVRTKAELSKLFAWWENEMKIDPSEMDGQNTTDQQRRLKASVKPPADQELLKMAFGDPSKMAKESPSAQF